MFQTEVFRDKKSQRRQTHIDVGDDSSSLVSQTSQLLVNPKHQNQHNANLIFRQYYVNAMDRSGKTNQFYLWCELKMRLQSNLINFQRIIRAVFKKTNRKICQLPKSEIRLLYTIIFNVGKILPSLKKPRRHLPKKNLKIGPSLIFPSPAVQHPPPIVVQTNQVKYFGTVTFYPLYIGLSQS